MGSAKERGGKFMVGIRARVLRSLLTSCAVVAFFVTAPVTWAQPVNPEAAKKEGKVVIYGTIVPQVMTLIEKGFESKYGLKVEYWRGRHEGDRPGAHRVACGQARF
jgi:hypothetical protein